MPIPSKHFAVAIMLAATACHRAPIPERTATRSDSLAAERDRLAQAVRGRIAGRESEAATQVFSNVKVLTTNVSADALLRAMGFYGASLGVSCSHCHVVGKWDSDEKEPKQIARQMMQMNGTINGQLLRAIAGLRSQNPSVNCATCHRGMIVPPKSS